MLQIPYELGCRASTGDMDSLNKIHYILQDEFLKTASEVKNLFLKYCDGQPFPQDIRYKLLEMSRSCLQLERSDLAELFQLFAYRGLHLDWEAEKWLLEIRSHQKRSFTLFCLDSILRLPAIASVYQEGQLPDSLNLKKGVRYLLTVETTKEEPKVSVPIYVSPGAVGPEVLDIDLEIWKGLGQTFIWVPGTRCFIGGDVAARNSLSRQLIDIGPFAVTQLNIKMGEYLETLRKFGEDHANSNYYPFYMGKPLVKYEKGRWESIDIPIKKGHNLSDIPVVGVDFQCSEWFCSTLQLPTHLRADILSETEWEVLARGPDERLFPWGDMGVPGFSNIRYGKQKEHGVESVGYRKSDISAFGLYDCCGNTEEWTKPVKGVTDTGEEYPIARGGSWYNPEQASRLASRVIRKSDYRHTKLSFRIVVRIKKP